jgi:hypothetical protein
MEQVMGILDGHGAHTIDKHYALREPKDDVVLAKCLVESVLGQTATWPTEENMKHTVITLLMDLVLNVRMNLMKMVPVGLACVRQMMVMKQNWITGQWGPYFGINHRVPELGDECEDWENFAAKGQASGSSSSAWMPDPLIAALPQQDVMTSNAHTSIAPHISSQDLYQKKTITSPEKLEVAATKKRHAEVLGDKLQPPPAPLLRTRIMIGK